MFTISIELAGRGFVMRSDGPRNLGDTATQVFRDAEVQELLEAVLDRLQVPYVKIDVVLPPATKGSK